LWLQKEVAEGKVLVSKVNGLESPADLMTKLLTVKEIMVRLKGMNLRLDSRNDVMMVGPVEVDSRRKFIPFNLDMISALLNNFVIRSAGFSVPKTLLTKTFPSKTSFWSQRSLISMCLIFPKPLLLTKLLAALLSVPK
jgi:hypothetical protein